MRKKKEKSKRPNFLQNSNEQLQNELQILSEARQKLHTSLLIMKRDQTFFKLEKDKRVATDEARALQDELRKIMELSTGIINNHLTNEALLVYLKIKITYGFTACLNREWELAVNCYDDVFQCLIKHDKRLMYENDLSFQYQFEDVCSEMNSIVRGNLYSKTNLVLQHSQAAYQLVFGNYTAFYPSS